ncbi:hypothetical protein Sjap_020188 [Stephania japonica]|uniref:Uncharacterized protein n=1 Tax=Stephania japonica TaxID=461633 RepID=A0AAP0F0Y3_9MAGN
MAHIIDLNKLVEEVVDLKKDNINNKEGEDINNLEEDDIVNETSQPIDGVTDKEPLEVISDDDLAGEVETIEVPINVGVIAEEAKEVSSEKGVPTDNQERSGTSDDVNDESSYEDEFEYDTKEDADDEGTSKPGRKDPYDGEEETNEEGADVSLSHIERLQDVGKDLHTKSTDMINGSNEKEDHGGTLHFSPSFSPNHQKDQPMKDNFQQPLEDIVSPIEDGQQLTDPNDDEVKDKPIASPIEQFDNLPTIGSHHAIEILMELLDWAKTLKEDVGEMKLVVQTTLATQRKEIKSIIFSAINSLKQDIGFMFGSMGDVFNTAIASWEDKFAKDLIYNY